MFCSQWCCASINTTMILFHTSSTRNEEWSHSNEYSVTIIQIQPHMNKRYISERKMPSMNKASCFWKIPNMLKPLTFLPKDAIFLYSIYSHGKNKINNLYLLQIAANLNYKFFSWIKAGIIITMPFHHPVCQKTVHCTALRDTDLWDIKNQKEEAFMSASFKPYCGNRNQALSLLQLWQFSTRKKEIHCQRIFPHWRNLHSPS